MREILVILIGASLCLGTRSLAASAPVRTEEISFPGGTATFCLRGTNLVYERVAYQEAGAHGGRTNNWVERFYYHGELAFRRCQTDNQVTETLLGIKGISVFHGHRATGPSGAGGDILSIAEIGKSLVPRGKDWLPPYELFKMGSDGFYYPEDPLSLIFSSFGWVSDTGSPSAESAEQQLRTLVLSRAQGEPGSPANRSQPLSSETNQPPVTAGSGR